MHDMTPEQRAAKIDWPDDLISMSKETCDALVAAAIRAAENDALNKAAAKILVAAHGELTRGRDRWYELLAESVLALRTHGS
jgi:hypothetical protein